MSLISLSSQYDRTCILSSTIYNIGSLYFFAAITSNKVEFKVMPRHFFFSWRIKFPINKKTSVWLFNSLYLRRYSNFSEKKKNNNSTLNQIFHVYLSFAWREAKKNQFWRQNQVFRVQQYKIKRTINYRNFCNIEIKFFVFRLVIVW